MKKILSICLALAMVLSLGMTQVAFAAEAAPVQENVAAEVSNNAEVQPRGSLSGYGSTWYSAGNARSGSFTVNVTVFLGLLLKQLSKLKALTAALVFGLVFTILMTLVFMTRFLGVVVI